MSLLIFSSQCDSIERESYNQQNKILLSPAWEELEMAMPKNHNAGFKFLLASKMCILKLLMPNECQTLRVLAMCTEIIQLKSLRLQCRKNIRYACWLTGWGRSRVSRQWCWCDAPPPSPCTGTSGHRASSCFQGEGSSRSWSGPSGTASAVEAKENTLKMSL